MTRYIEIYNDIKRKILDGIYVYGTKLPSKRVTAADNGVSVITVEHAYDLLFEEGYIVSKEKSGYFVAYREKEGFEGHLAASDPEAFRIRLPEVTLEERGNDGISFNIYAKTARRVLSEYSEEVMEKVSGYGSPRLRNVLSEYLLNYRGIKASPERIVIGAGAETLYGLIIKAIGRSSAFGIENPSYQKIAAIYEAEGIRIDPLPLSHDGIESKALWESKASVLHITPYRSFPTGVTASAAKKAEYIRWMKERNAIIIEDDFESEFTTSKKAEETLYSMAPEGRVIYVNTFTRTVGAFIRLAYMVIPESLEEIFKEKIGFYSSSVSAMEQLIMAELIDNGDFVRHINRVRRRKREEKLK